MKCITIFDTNGLFCVFQRKNGEIWSAVAGGKTAGLGRDFLPFRVGPVNQSLKKKKFFFFSMNPSLELVEQRFLLIENGSLRFQLTGCSCTSISTAICGSRSSGARSPTGSSCRSTCRSVWARNDNVRRKSLGIFAFFVSLRRKRNIHTINILISDSIQRGTNKKRVDDETKGRYLEVFFDLGRQRPSAAALLGLEAAQERLDARVVVDGEVQALADHAHRHVLAKQSQEKESVCRVGSPLHSHDSGSPSKVVYEVDYLLDNMVLRRP